MSLVEISLVFALGLAASLHCVQMCGPIVISYSVFLKRDMMLAHLSYNAGRVITYSALGALAGAAGSGIGMIGKLAGLASAARLLAGGAMVVTGILMLRVLPRKVLIQVERRGMMALFSRSIGRLLVSSRTLGKFGLGLMLGFLPCGLIYGALLKAVETARPLAGALTMAAFGTGTAVALLAMGMASSFAGLRMGAWGNRLAGASILLAGAILVWRGLTAGPVCHG
jgi:sulfite exporter TauE/SafE